MYMSIYIYVLLYICFLSLKRHIYNETYIEEHNYGWIYILKQLYTK